jgi:hypothetical protein
LLAWTVYPLNVVSDVRTRVIRPLTLPASEFQLTWSPRLNRRIVNPTASLMAQ